MMLCVTKIIHKLELSVCYSKAESGRLLPAQLALLTVWRYSTRWGRRCF